MHLRDVLHIQQFIIKTKAQVKLQPDWLEFLREKVKRQKKHTLCILSMPQIQSSLVTWSSPYQCFMWNFSLKIFPAKVEKVQETHKLCLIILINPSSYLEKIIFDLQISLPRVHPVQSSSQITKLLLTCITQKNRDLFPNTARTRFFPDMLFLQGVRGC